MNGGMNAQQFYDMANENRQQNGQHQQQAKDSWTCPGCGKQCTGKFCSECGAKRPGQVRCSACGWTSESSKQPQFCPECGKKFESDEM